MALRRDVHRGVSSPDEGDTLDTYCRAVEAHLCRRNGGHLIRIAGPSFERVRGWAVEGVPLKVVCLGIDRFVSRQESKGRRRRPAQIDHCEADVRDAFDEWRQALGVPAGAESGGDAPRRRREPLPVHLDRVIARLTLARTDAGPTLETALAAAVRELDAARATASGLRAASRQALLSRLGEIDGVLLASAAADLPSEERRAVRREAEAEVEPYRSRMPPEAFAAAVERCTARLIRDRCHLPTLELP